MGDPARCRCQHPLTAVDGPHWWPSRDPEPDGRVSTVAIYGEDPRFLRKVRASDGWHTEGAAASYPENSPPRPWSQLGMCWAGNQHPVVDATGWDQARRAPEVRNVSGTAGAATAGPGSLRPRSGRT